MLLTHIAEKPILQVHFAEIAGVIVAKDPLDMSSRQNLSDDVEHRVIVERLANLVQFFKQLIQDAALYGVRRHKIENQAILSLAVSMDTTHSLLKPVGIPRNVVIEHYVAALQVDAFARCLGCDQNLDRSFTELLLCEEARALFVARSGAHPAVDEAHSKAPFD